jgi:hypothetical protein
MAGSVAGSSQTQTLLKACTQGLANIMGLGAVEAHIGRASAHLRAEEEEEEGEGEEKEEAEEAPHTDRAHADRVHADRAHADRVHASRSPPGCTRSGGLEPVIAAQAATHTCTQISLQTIQQQQQQQQHSSSSNSSAFGNARPNGVPHLLPGPWPGTSYSYSLPVRIQTGRLQDV